MTDFVNVCALNDINKDTGVCALVNGQQVAIFRPAGTEELFALGNFDPVGKANVLSRGLICDIKGQLTVASPLYKQHYVLADGSCLEDDTLSIPTYAVKVDGDRVLVAA